MSYIILDKSRVDDKNRIVLHTSIRKELGVKPGSIVAFVRRGKVLGLVNMSDISIIVRGEEVEE